MPELVVGTFADAEFEAIGLGLNKADLEGEGLSLNAGISCVLPDCEDENTLYLCNRHGVFKTTNRGRSYRLVKGVED